MNFNDSDKPKLLELFSLKVTIEVLEEYYPPAVVDQPVKAEHIERQLLKFFAEGNSSLKVPVPKQKFRNYIQQHIVDCFSQELNQNELKKLNLVNFKVYRGSIIIEALVTTYMVVANLENFQKGFVRLSNSLDSYISSVLSEILQFPQNRFLVNNELQPGPVFGGVEKTNRIDNSIENELALIGVSIAGVVSVTSSNGDFGFIDCAVGILLILMLTPAILADKPRHLRYLISAVCGMCSLLVAGIFIQKHLSFICLKCEDDQLYFVFWLAATFVWMKFIKIIEKKMTFL